MNPPEQSKSRTGPRRATAPAQRVLDHFRRIVQALRISSRAAQSRTGLSGAQLFVLQKLAASRNRGLSVNELADQTLTHQSSVSVVAARLVQQGLVSRRRSAGDARRLELSATPAGLAILRKSPKAAQEGLIDGVSRMPESDRIQLAGLLDQLVELAGLSTQQAEMFFESQTAAKPQSAQGKKPRNGT